MASDGPRFIVQVRRVDGVAWKRCGLARARVLWSKWRTVSKFDDVESAIGGAERVSSYGTTTIARVTWKGRAIAWCDHRGTSVSKANRDAPLLAHIRLAIGRPEEPT